MTFFTFSRFCGSVYYASTGLDKNKITIARSANNRCKQCKKKLISKARNERINFFKGILQRCF